MRLRFKSLLRLTDIIMCICVFMLLQEEQIEQRGMLYSIKPEFGGHRFPQHSSSGGSSNSGAASSQHVDESEEVVYAIGDDDEDAAGEQQAHHLLYEDKSFDTNNLMPD